MCLNCWFFLPQTSIISSVITRWYKVRNRRRNKIKFPMLMSCFVPLWKNESFSNVHSVCGFGAVQLLFCSWRPTPCVGEYYWMWEMHFKAKDNQCLLRVKEGGRRREKLMHVLDCSLSLKSEWYCEIAFLVQPGQTIYSLVMALWGERVKSERLKRGTQGWRER